MTNNPQAFPGLNQHTVTSSKGTEIINNPANPGMTLREYAAIKLCVPESGLDWLDDMIRKSQRDRFAGQALKGLCSTPTWFHPSDCNEIAIRSILMADAMMRRYAAREQKGE